MRAEKKRNKSISSFNRSYETSQGGLCFPNQGDLMGTIQKPDRHFEPWNTNNVSR